MSTRKLPYRFAVIALLSSCVGEVLGGPKEPVGSPQDPVIPGGPTQSGLAWQVSYGGTPSGLRRLTRDEVIVSMQVLTGTASARDDLPAEPRGDGPLLTGGLPYVATELPKLDLAISAFSANAAPAMLLRSGCAVTGAAQRACLLTWAQGFANRALRRPAHDGEAALLTTLLAAADGTPANDTGAVGDVLDAIFFSPSFLYRSEIGVPDPSSPDLRALTPLELASRLSYLATLGPPDDALLAAASSGALSDGQARVDQLHRLLGSTLGAHALSVLVLEWLGASEPTLHTKSAAYLGGLPADFESQVRASAESTIAKVLTSAEPTVGHLLSTTSYLGDAPIQAITQGDTGDTEREGLLMHPQVLGAHTKEDGVSPFRVGHFLREAVLCQHVSPPPPGAQAMALPDVPGLTLRQQFEHKISAGASCMACHAQFAPLGYTFLPFDPVGRWTKQDPTGQSWDLSGKISTYGGPLAFQSPRDLVEQLGSDAQVQGCFAQTALQWSLGRGLVSQDVASVTALDASVKQHGGDVLKVLETIVAAPQFATAVAAR